MYTCVYVSFSARTYEIIVKSSCRLVAGVADEIEEQKMSSFALSKLNTLRYITVVCGGWVVLLNVCPCVLYRITGGGDDDEDHDEYTHKRESTKS